MFALIDAGVNNARAKDAEKSVVPLRESLVGYEFDPRAEMASAMTLSGLDWFGAKQTQLTKDESGDASLAALDASAAPQLMVMRYSYETTADFSAILVHLNTTLLKKEIPKGKKSNARLNPKNMAYVQSVRSVILLPDANPKDPDGNVRAWAADGGRAARAALDLGIERCQQLLQRGLTQSAADAASMAKRNKRPLSSVPGVSGWEIEKQPTSTLVYEFLLGSLTQVETLGAAPAAPAVATAPAADAAAPAAAAATGRGCASGGSRAGQLKQLRRRPRSERTAAQHQRRGRGAGGPAGSGLRHGAHEAHRDVLESGYTAAQRATSGQGQDSRAGLCADRRCHLRHTQ